jgi:hypothetical protein
MHDLNLKLSRLQPAAAVALVQMAAACERWRRDNIKSGVRQATRTQNTVELNAAIDQWVKLKE